MTPKQTALKLMKELGVTYEDASGDGYFDVCLDAPEGMIFTASGCHTAVTAQSPRVHNDRVVGGSVFGWRYVVEDLRAGIEPCPDGDDCEYCHP